MGYALLEYETGNIVAWQRNDVPDHDPSRFGVVEADSFEAAMLTEQRNSVAMETLRTEKIAALTAWWESHPGIEVLPSIVLPIQEAGRNTNTASLSLALLTQTEVIDLVSVDDYTVQIPASDVATALGAFRAAYTVISQHWDQMHRALVAATTLAEMEAIEVTP
jgi:hypothetical protein